MLDTKPKAAPLPAVQPAAPGAQPQHESPNQPKPSLGQMELPLSRKTAPRNVDTSIWHMLSHTTSVPQVEPLPGEYHRIAVEFNNGAQHNPTVFVDADGALRGIIRVLHGTLTTNYLGRIGPNWRFDNPERISCNVMIGQLEDFRAFIWGGRLWAIAATHGGGNPPWAIRQALVELDPVSGEILQAHVQPSHRHEKNWMPCADGDELRLVYSTHPLKTFQVTAAPGVCRALPGALSIEQGLSHIRGSTQLVRYQDGWLALVHQVYRPKLEAPGHNPLLGFFPEVVKDPVAGDEKVVYLHKFAKFSRELDKVELSAPFYFRRIGIEFACGLAPWGDGFVASFGVADKEAWLVEVTAETVEQSFEGA
jgi:hypothetical protein